MKIKLPSVRLTYFLGFLIVAGLIGVSVILQYQVGLNPCPLCILQRFSLILLGVTFFLGALFRLNKYANYFFAMMGFLFALLGAFLSSRQVYMQHVPTQAADCSVSLEYMLKVLPWNEVVAHVFKGSSECTQVGWKFLYLSLAEWSLIAFIFFIALSLFQLSRRP